MPENKRNHPAPNEDEQKRTRDEEHPRRPESDTLEGPGGHDESKGEEDARNKTTRRGERQ